MIIYFKDIPVPNFNVDETLCLSVYIMQTIFMISEPMAKGGEITGLIYTAYPTPSMQIIYTQQSFYTIFEIMLYDIYIKYCIVQTVDLAVYFTKQINIL